MVRSFDFTQDKFHSPQVPLNQKGFAPLVIILIIAVTIVGGYGVYRSSNQFNVRSDKTTEKVGGRLQEKAPEKDKIELANSGKLANSPVTLPVEEVKDEEEKVVPQFSITPPAGWDKLPPSGQILVEFLSAAKDEISAGMAYIDIQPNITVFVAKGEFSSLDEAYNANSRKDKKVSSQQKITVNGQEAMKTESTQDAADLLRGTLEAQIKQEIAKSGTKVSDEALHKDVEKVLEQAEVKIISYSFYKDGYYINVAGKSLEKFWDKRGPQIKRSLDSFKLSP